MFAHAKSLMTTALAAFAAPAAADTVVQQIAPATNTVSVMKTGQVFRECTHCPEMVILPAGSFTMGSPEDEKGRFANEGPQHRITIAYRIAFATRLVTVGEYRQFAKATGRPAGSSCRIYDPSFVDADLVRVRGYNWRKPNFRQADDHPVVCISYDDATAYARWLNHGLDPHGDGSGAYRLPTEAEWEYAARAGTDTAYYWGEAIERSRANYGPDALPFAPVASGADKWKYTSPVGAFPANPFGLYDMAGNVWQFTQDCWHETYDGAPTDGSARISDTCGERAVRGGSWFKPPMGERSAKRGQGKIADLKGNHEIGFRLVREIPAASRDPR